MSEFKPNYTPEYSKLDEISMLPQEQQDEFYRTFSEMTPEQQDEFMHNPEVVLRPKQQPPSMEHSNVIYILGRSWGKSLTSAYIVNQWANKYPGCSIAVVGATSHDCRDIMVSGISGILNTCAAHLRPKYVPSKRKLYWPNGSSATTISAEKQEQSRGGEYHFIWMDELVKFQYAEAVYDNLRLTHRGKRLPDFPKDYRPQMVVSTTPKPTPLIKKFATAPNWHVVRGSTYENGRLPKEFIDDCYAQEGTAWARQELHGEILTVNQNALFNLETINQHRVSREDFDINTLNNIVISVDPAVTANENSDKTGISVVGIDDRDHAFVLESIAIKASPQEWGTKAVMMYHKYNASGIVIETNQGGDMNKQIINSIDENIKVFEVRAKVGKTTRAEPVAAIYEQGRCHHVGIHDDLETQMCLWDASAKNQKSPDMMDSLVWAIFHLIIQHKKTNLWVLDY